MCNPEEDPNFESEKGLLMVTGSLYPQDHVKKPPEKSKDNWKITAWVTVTTKEPDYPNIQCVCQKEKPKCFLKLFL